MSATERRRCAQCEKNRDVQSFSGLKGRICKTCRRATARRTARRNHLLKTYGLSLEDYEALLRAQGGVCAICHGARSYNLAVDHCHKTEAAWIDVGLDPQIAARRSVRGLLCKAHNKLLREVRDNPQILRAAADYLDDAPAPRTLGRRDVTADDEASIRQGPQAA